MTRRSPCWWCVTACLLLAAPQCFAFPSPQSAAETGGRGTGGQPISADLRVQSLDFSQQSAVMLEGPQRKEVPVALHGKVGPWTLMAVLREPQGGAAVFENVEDRKGS